MSIDTLKQIVPPPVQPTGVPTATQLTELERDCGTLPQDYLELLALYGSGTFRNGTWLRVWSPWHTGYVRFYRTLTSSLEVSADEYRRAGEEFPFELWPIDPGLLPLADDNGANELFYLTNADLGSWSLVLFQHGDVEHEIHDLTLSEFLVKLFTGHLATRAWDGGRHFTGESRIEFVPDDASRIGTARQPVPR